MIEKIVSQSKRYKKNDGTLIILPDRSKKHQDQLKIKALIREVWICFD